MASLERETDTKASVRCAVSSYENAIAKGASPTTAWRAAKRGWFIKDYHKKRINPEPHMQLAVDPDDLYRIAAGCIKRIVNPSEMWFDDIVSEAVYRFLAQSGDDNSYKRFCSTARYTAYDFLKTRVWKDSHNYLPLNEEVISCQEQPN